MACVDTDTLSAYWIPEQIFTVNVSHLTFSNRLSCIGDLTCPHEWKDDAVNFPKYLAELLGSEFLLCRVNDILHRIADLLPSRRLELAVVNGGNDGVQPFFCHRGRRTVDVDRLRFWRLFSARWNTCFFVRAMEKSEYTALDSFHVAGQHQFR